MKWFVLPIVTYYFVAGLFCYADYTNAQQILIDRLVASVNATIILQSDVKKFRETLRLRAQLDPLFSGTAVATKGAGALIADVVEFLVDETIIAQHFPVADSEVEQEINSIQVNNKIDRARLKAAINEQGFLFQDYFELIRISTSKRNLIDRDIRTKVAISEDDVKNFFYNRYSKTSIVPLEYKLQIISVSIINYKTSTAAKDVIERAKAALRGGESFEEVAKRYSDHFSSSSGGELGTLTEDQMSLVIREEVKKLKIGEVSPIFGGLSSRAYYIVKLVDVKSSEPSKIEKMKYEIRNQLTASEYQHQISLWLERQRQVSFIHKVEPLAVQ